MTLLGVWFSVCFAAAVTAQDAAQPPRTAIVVDLQSLQQRKREASVLLVAAHRLTVEEAAVAARMGTLVQVEDRRMEKSMPLPDVSTLE